MNIFASEWNNENWAKENQGANKCWKRKKKREENMMKKFDKSFAAHEKRMCKYIYIG